MTKRNLSSILLALFMLSLFGCGAREQGPEWIWRAEMLGEAGSTEGYSALAATGESIFLLTEAQLYTRPLDRPEAEPEPLCTLGRKDFVRLCVDAAGNFWAANYGGWVCAYSPESETLLEYCFSLETGFSSVYSLFALPDGGVGCTIAVRSGGFRTYRFDLDVTEPQEVPALSPRAEPVYFAGPTPDGELLGWDNTSIFRLPYSELEEGETFDREKLEEICSLESCGLVATGFSILAMAAEDSLIALNQNAEMLICLRRLPADQAEEKKTLTLGVYSYLQQEIAAGIAVFNIENPNIQIQPTVYTSWTQMALEITAGQAPDLLVSSTLPFDEYAAKGLFEDLYPFLEREDLELVQPALKAMETEGALYRLGPGFSVSTLLGNSDYVGTEMGWTWAEFQAALAAAPEGARPLPLSWTRDSVYNLLISRVLDQFLDWEHGTAFFDSEDFKALLELGSTYPETYSGEYPDNMEMLRQGAALTCDTVVNSFDDFVRRDNMLDGKLVCKGYPGQARCTGILWPEFTLSITTNCEDKAAAWAFISHFLQEDYAPPYILAQEVRFPINQALFNAQAEEAMSTGGQSTGEDEQEPAPVMTQAQYDKCIAFLESVETTMGSIGNQALKGIVQEELSAYYAGQRSLEETCAIIQSRAQTYVSEQMG